MGQQIIKQPDGLFAIYDSVSSTIELWDATEEEVVEDFAERGAAIFRRDAQREIDHVKAGNPRKAYFQFAKTWDEALEIDREHDGEAWREFAK